MFVYLVPSEERLVRISHRLKSDAGSALVEFLVFGLVLQVGILTFFLDLSNQQADQLAAESIARHGLRAFVISDINPRVTAQQIAADFNLKAEPKLQLICDPNCFSSGSLLHLRVQVQSSEAEAVLVR